MDVRSSGRTNLPDRGGGFLRLIAILGIVYAVLSLLELLNYRFLFSNNAWLLIQRVHYLIFRALTELSSIALLIGSLQLFRRRAGARGILFAWSICVLTLQLLYFASLRQSQSVLSLSVLSGEDIQVMVGNFVLIWLDCGFPLVLLFTMNLPQDGGTGFSVILKDSGAQATGERGGGLAAAGDIQRSLAWVGLLLGGAGVIGIVLHVSGWTMTRWQSANSVWRAGTLEALATIGLFSYLLLLGGSILMLLRHRRGRVMLFAWAVLFLSVQLSSAVLYDIPFVYWQATNGPARAYRWMTVEGASHLYAVVRVCAFAIVALYCFWSRDGVRMSDHNESRDAQAPAATNPAADGL